MPHAHRHKHMHIYERSILRNLWYKPFGRLGYQYPKAREGSWYYLFNQRKSIGWTIRRLQIWVDCLVVAYIAFLGIRVGWAPKLPHHLDTLDDNKFVAQYFDFADFDSMKQRRQAILEDLEKTKAEHAASQ
eukprot:NODE_363_length_906_cov_309.679076_g355_i0.p1 GENE.NODE_363_length_906_cov_309.679076_g355_i0~~NODE_363_length_906_cov_309.679076_g355_i0.p1  ORF type:complete len:152 (-),score=28.64 NODE_363_length_906_cov_309.679076_g355_i0:449-841(-)